MLQNPNWTRDELILALNLFFRTGRKQLDYTHPEVIKLSKLLNSLPIWGTDLRNLNFRNAYGVSMKLGNFKRFDPEYSGKGLERGSKLDEEVWNEFSINPEKLEERADLIAKSIITLGTNETSIADDEEFAEGKILTILHKFKERNRKVVKEKKKSVLQKTGKLECEVCGFDFGKVYGSLGDGFAECHHTVPISKINPDHKTLLKDLAILCANCHRMIHNSSPMYTVQELRTVIQNNYR